MSASASTTLPIGFPAPWPASASTLNSIGEVAWSAPDELFAQIVDHVAATGGRNRLFLQVDGTDEEALAAPLSDTCGEVVVVPIYRWALPVDVGPAEALVGAGTVTTLADVARLDGIGADLVVMPHADTEVIAAANQRGLAMVFTGRRHFRH